MNTQFRKKKSRIFLRSYRMNKAELVEAIAKKTKSTKKDTEEMLNAFMDVVKTNLKKNQKIMLVGFGTFQTYKRKATTGVNPKTRKKISIPEKRVAKLKWSDTVNNLLN